MCAPEKKRPRRIVCAAFSGGRSIVSLPRTWKPSEGRQTRVVRNAPPAPVLQPVLLVASNDCSYPRHERCLLGVPKPQRDSAPRLRLFPTGRPFARHPAKGRPSVEPTPFCPMLNIGQTRFPFHPVYSRPRTGLHGIIGGGIRISAHRQRGNRHATPRKFPRNQIGGVGHAAAHAALPPVIVYNKSTEQPAPLLIRALMLRRFYPCCCRRTADRFKSPIRC